MYVRIKNRVLIFFQAMVEYMSDSFLQMEMKTSVECQQQLIRAFRVAHDKIIEGTPPDEIWTVGQTTLIGGMLVPTAGKFFWFVPCFIKFLFLTSFRFVRGTGMDGNFCLYWRL